MFWSPPDCIEARGASRNKKMHIIHKNADLKPYVVQLHFVAPPAGTGTISFRVLESVFYN